MDALLSFAAALVACGSRRCSCGASRDARDAALAALGRRARAPTRSPRRRSRGAARPGGATRRSASTTAAAGCSRRRSSARARSLRDGRRLGAPVALAMDGPRASAWRSRCRCTGARGRRRSRRRRRTSRSGRRARSPIVANSLGTLAVVGVALAHDPAAAARERAHPRPASRSPRRAAASRGLGVARDGALHARRGRACSTAGFVAPAHLPQRVQRLIGSRT